ncbi:hypothetical protein [Blastomonas fulva]|jgi:hypothetical protein|nr:hypothetical protein [Blastomonas fulva]
MIARRSAEPPDRTIKIHFPSVARCVSFGNGCRQSVLAGFRALALTAGLIILPAPAHAQDFFNGMVVTDEQGLVLDRCHLGGTRYRLIAADGADDPLARLRGQKGLIQIEVIARYRADGEAHVLEVLSVESISVGRSCHLFDAVDAAFDPEHVAERDITDRWEALALASVAPADVAVIGSGDYAYRFVLLQPRTGKPAPDTDYALSISRTTGYELPFVADEKKVFQGRTDGEGRTPVFRLPVRLPDGAFDLRERFGSGPYGETFHLTDHHDNDLFNMPYLIITCTNPPRFFWGYTYPNGDTAYTASDGPINIQLRVLAHIDDPLPTDCDDGRSEDGDDTAAQTTSANGEVAAGDE